MDDIFQNSPISYSFKTLSRAVSFVGGLNPIQGFVSASAVEFAHEKKVLRVARSLLLIIGAPRSHIELRKREISLLEISLICLPLKTGSNSVLNCLSISWAVLF